MLKGDSTTTDKATFIQSGYAVAGDLYAEGSDTALTTAQLKEALEKGQKIYTDTSANGQTDDKIAKANKDYAYVTKLYDKDGKEVSAENVLAGKNADGTTDAQHYYTSDAGKTGNDNDANVAIAVADAKKTDGTGYLEQFDVNGKLSFNLHVGADSSSNNKIGVEISSMSAAGIGVKNLKVDTEYDATAAVDRISAAIQKVSTQRSALGAVQNRLEHTINNLDNVVENTTSAESQIRDTDMATEMVKYSNNNILAQAGQAMLAQSNQANQGVLSLLQ